ncbi:hypothetical protein BD626DRAFT_529381 [Schizophyllum amplum]|uniref:Uncharacterized protein n=1 Tax=Schizophyllum amplum TaxID=97359 RepID=A0A550BRX0_9AGAR|nr:hypothetical protein BD626DRAFT_529381 [Auriculariopsis ampla]
MRIYVFYLVICLFHHSRIHRLKSLYCKTTCRYRAVLPAIEASTTALHNQPHRPRAYTPSSLALVAEHQ